MTLKRHIRSNHPADIGGWYCAEGPVSDDEDFSAEELEILGEEPNEEEPPKKGDEEDPGTPGEEEEEEPKPAEGAEDTTDKEDTEEPGKPGDKDTKENLIPQSRVDEIVKTERTKLDLLKADPDEYYRKYPDEKPKEDTEEEEETDTDEDTKLMSMSEAASMTITSGPYEGESLGEVAKKDPLAAMEAYNNYRDDVLKKQQEKKERDDALKDKSNRELATFADSMAQQAFKKGFKDLDKDQTDQINGVINNTLDWMEKTGRGFGNIEDAYFLMNKDKIIADARKGVFGDVVQSLNKGDEVHNVSASKGGGGSSEYDACMEMTPAEMAAKVDNMGDDEFLKFTKNAPPELRKKFPGVEWDG